MPSSGHLAGEAEGMPPARLALFDGLGVWALWDWELEAFQAVREAPFAASGRTAWFEITTVCDQVCRHCFMWDRLRKGHVPTEHLMKALAAAAAYAPEEVVLSGGEATLHPDFTLVVAEAADRIGAVRVLSNGRTHRDDIVQALSRPEVRVDIPLLGWEKEHEFMTGVPGSFERARSTIACYRAAGVRVTITTTLTRFAQRALPQLQGLADELSVPLEPSALFRVGRAVDTWDEIAPEGDRTVAGVAGN